MSEQESSTLEIIFIGTGTSSGVPEVGCLVKDLASDEEPCETCYSTIDRGDGEGIKDSKNIRGNTSAIIRKTFDDGKTTTLLIDCGKTWRDSALKYWRANGVSRIDGILLTHLHSDATLGLDDLRTLTLHVQDSIDVYCDKQTMDDLKKRFDYLFPTSGARFLPTLNWKLIIYEKTLSIGGIDILPLPVQHGTTLQQIPPIVGTLQPGSKSAEAQRVPFIIPAFIFDSDVVYMSDVDFIPETTWKILLKPPKVECENPPPTKYPLFILDCTYMEDMLHSHLDIAGALEVALQLNPSNTFLVGMCHLVVHSKLEALCEEVEGVRAPGKESAWVAEAVQKYLSKEHLFDRAKSTRIKVRPAFDGLRLRIRGGEVTKY